ncbi:MAG: hypothetical protein BMS9Abin17_0634 [Acidimicrobiia bacterium]|nr:MAG: hypothetical protein BMS9Abin17_0634 [Acidimicrobiia bacterium]
MSVNHPVKTPDSREIAKNLGREMGGMRRGRSEIIGSRKRRTVVAMFAVAVALAGAGVLAAPPSALAHGGDDEANAVDLVEQALAIVVNTPDAVGEALERVEAALAEEAEESTGELDIASLELAAVALETGDLHDAEDALVAALGIDPHANEDEPVEAVEEVPIVPLDGSADADVVPDSDQTGGTEDSNDVERPAETAAASTSVASHGLTERVDGGFRAPTGTGVAALALAGVLAVGGFALAHSRTGVK